ncbi:hypothetical protein [Dietzia alimentaria]|uniref:hypothetical protein n=1 Tax=Dietzia alimentaria TaxID=665550 RepID=UPI00029A8FE5|nr:hypothetical protein [Dietzia alimentaria]
MNRPTTHWLTKRVTAALATALIVFLAVAAALLVRGDAYDARIGLLAVPGATPSAAETADFGVVVANSLPALIEVAHSASALTAAAERVPGAPGDPTEIAEDVTVELVPASGLARLTVRAENPDVAAGLASELADELVQAELLSPTADLRVLDPVPTVRHASPDLLLALGIAVVAGVICGVAALGAATLWWPRPARRLRRLLADSGTGHPVVMVDDDGSVDSLKQLRLLRATVGRPLRLVATEPQLADAAARLADALSLDPAPVTDKRRIAVGLVTNSRADSAVLRAAIGSLPDPREIVAVILSGEEANPEEARGEAEPNESAATVTTDPIGDPPMSDGPVTGEAASATAR